jgi:5-(carboxyamino)imidazole ribonucleotide synthase
MSEGSPNTILPGAMIGLLGGGQLARMTALAARSMGYRIAVLDPDPQCAASALADVVIGASFDDPVAAVKLARQSDVVTYEIERIAPAALRSAQEAGLLRPQADVLEKVQDRERQKRWLESHGHPLGPWKLAGNAQDLEAALGEFGICRVKRTYGGYDGRSQLRVTGREFAEKAMRDLNGVCVAEKELDLEMELSVLIARSPDGNVAAHPVSANWHEDGTLVRSLIPAPIDPAIAGKAVELAKAVACDLRVEGLLAVELFLTRRGEMLVNELAPRPHNTFHAAGAACTIGQFEQYIRAVCGLPLGHPEVHGSAVLINLLGDLWVGNEQPPFSTVLAIPGVSLHLYGKQPRPRRKVGHLVARGATAEVALERADQAMRALQMRVTEASFK